MIATNIAKLQDRDLYSLALFALYKLIDVPEYSSLSELVYVLDKSNFLNLCQFFGGQTIHVPTLDELEILIYALILFKRTKLDHDPLEEAQQYLVDNGCRDVKAVRKQYNKLIEVISKYDFQVNREY